MSQGIKFFDENFAEQAKGGTVTPSSGTSTQWFAFDGRKDTFWVTSGEGTDGDSVSLERDFQTSRTIDTLYIYNTNIDNIAYDYWNGASWTSITGSNATITKSSDGMYIHIKLNSATATEKIRITGSNTIVADEEKKVGLVIATSELGQLAYRPFLIPEIELNQIIHDLDDGRSFIIEKGENFKCELQFKSHVNQADIDLIESIISAKKPFHIWPCGGDVAQFRFLFRPYRFQDVFKMGITGKLTPFLTRNFYGAGYNNPVKMIEVG